MPPAQGGIQILGAILTWNFVSFSRQPHELWPSANEGHGSKAASPGRDTNPGHDLQSSSEVMSTLPADATDCRRCSRDFRKEDREWEATATQLCPNLGNFKGEPDDPSLAPRDRLLRRPSVCVNIPVSHICHHLARLLPLGWCSTVVVSCSTDLDPLILVPGASKLEDRS